MLATLLLALAATAQTGLPVQSLAINGNRFTVEVASTDAQRSAGLMYRHALPTGHGMWFVFNDENPQSFWMENTLVPLDILYFDHARRLVAQQLNVPPCHAAPCPLYPSDVPAQYVLEVPAGTAHQLRLQLGDAAILSLNKKDL